jgi:hypothetical protein
MAPAPAPGAALLVDGLWRLLSAVPAVMRRSRKSDPRILVCADCSRTVLWHSDEAGEWPTVADGDRFGTVCSDCYRKRYGEDEASQYEQQTRVEQQDERES